MQDCMLMFAMPVLDYWKKMSVYFDWSEIERKTKEYAEKLVRYLGDSESINSLTMDGLNSLREYIFVR